MVSGSQDHPYFFFSYASRDYEDDKSFQRFFDDLCKTVAAETDRDKNDVAFRDSASIGLGGEWPPQLVNALRTCQCFVPVLTPRLINHPFCGYEWQAFQNRLSAAPSPADGKPSRLLPILWRPFDLESAPQVIKDHQYKHAVFGQAYADNGLVVLAQQKKFEDDYWDFLSKFARMMKEAVRSAPLPSFTGPLDREAIPNAFEPTETELDDFLDLSGADHVLVMIAAGSKSELEGSRNDVSCYGPIWRRWRPFPPPALAAASIAQQALSGQDLNSTARRLNNALIERLKNSARGSDCIFVILLDPWSVRLPLYVQPLQRIDEWRFRSGAVFTVWSDDVETNTRRDELEQRIKDVIPALAEEFPSRSLFNVPPNDADFSQHLVRIVTEIQARMFSTHDNPPTIGGGEPTLPQVQGPGGSLA